LLRSLKTRGFSGVQLVKHPGELAETVATAAALTA
jgi:hypothetical protein